MDIAVVILEIRVMVHRLEPWFPAVVTGQETGERGLTTTYISCYCDMLLSIFFVRHRIFFELIGKIGARKY